MLSFPSTPSLPPTPQLKAVFVFWVTTVGTEIRDGATLGHLFPWAAVPRPARNQPALLPSLETLF